MFIMKVIVLMVVLMFDIYCEVVMLEGVLL